MNHVQIIYMYIAYFDFWALFDPLAMGITLARTVGMHVIEMDASCRSGFGKK